ncbi:helix-turn-helix domain-containing protein [Paenibacillus puerhi]|uniref:helix-turn-helix domain-containing protein n=1 Tax=Paenibacillus puerhi TaxID=2692622 RepID=UPI00135ABE36|nr:helix-turn-helix domain-containing protein [Paenibacillus puerhi]
MGNELFDLVQRAQSGESEAMQEIISLFMPAIRCARSKFKTDRQDDLEQNIVEMILKKIMTYDLNQTPDFSAYCRQLNELRPINGPWKKSELDKIWCYKILDKSKVLQH